MEEPWKEVLLEYRHAIVNSADPHDVFLNYLIDHLLSKRCIQHDHSQLVKHERFPRARVGKLLDFVSSEGSQAFDELCNALEEFGTEYKKQLANTLRRSFGERNIVSGRPSYHFDKLDVFHAWAGLAAGRRKAAPVPLLAGMWTGPSGPRPRRDRDETFTKTLRDRDEASQTFSETRPRQSITILNCPHIT